MPRRQRRDKRRYDRLSAGDLMDLVCGAFPSEVTSCGTVPFDPAAVPDDQRAEFERLRERWETHCDVIASEWLAPDAAPPWAWWVYEMRLPQPTAREAERAALQLMGIDNWRDHIAQHEEDTE